MRKDLKEVIADELRRQGVDVDAIDIDELERIVCAWVAEEVL
jgi:hypothetical protein